MKFLYLATAALALVQGEQQFTQKSDFFESFLPKEAKDEPTTPCCIKCTEPLEKYHSVDHTFNHCGEACMNPKQYWLYKIFEPGLEKSRTNTPCADRNYTVYKNTPTHGFGPVKMTLDLYDPSPKLILAQMGEEI